MFSLGFGFGGQVASSVNTPHPAEQPVLVIFVLGGISYREAGQVQQVLRSNAMISNARIVLLSTRIVGAENILYQVFH